MRRFAIISLVLLLAACASAPPPKAATTGDNFEIETTLIATYNGV